MPSETEIAVIDIETTGFATSKAHIIEIGAALLELQSGSITTLFDSLIKEEGFGSHCKHCWSFENTDLSFHDVIKLGKSIDDIRSELQDIFDKYYITAFNSSFDTRFLTHRGFTFPNQAPCIMKVSMPIINLKDIRGRTKRPKAQEAWDFFYPDTPYTEKHRGLDDAIHEAKILYKMYQNNQYHLE